MSLPRATARPWTRTRWWWLEKVVLWDILPADYCRYAGSLPVALSNGLCKLGHGTSISLYFLACIFSQIFANRDVHFRKSLCIFSQTTLHIFANRFAYFCKTRFAKICNAICKNMQRDFQKYAKICNAIYENVQKYATRKMPNLRKSVQYREKFTGKSAQCLNLHKMFKSFLCLFCPNFIPEHPFSK